MLRHSRRMRCCVPVGTPVRVGSPAPIQAMRSDLDPLTQACIQVRMGTILIHDDHSMRACALGLLLFIGSFFAVAAQADEGERQIVIRNHAFEPAESTVPSGVRIRLAIDNQDPTPEEFESYELNREKIVPGSQRIVVYVGPLKQGRYRFFGDFHKDTAQGVLIAR